MTSLPDRLTAALRITEEAARIALAHFRAPLDIETKRDESPVTMADKATEQAIRDGLAQAFPGEAIFGEEFGMSGDSQDFWVVDPIDGTRSFIAGYPMFGMLLGHARGGAPDLGVIRMPALGEVYSGTKCQGAWCNGTAIRTSTCTDLSQARLFINEADKLARDVPDVFDRLVRSGTLRRTGADCYPHALVAAGHVDAVVDYDLQPYDYLSVAAVVQAAGGVMTDWQGHALNMASDGRVVSAATPELHSDLLDMLNRA